MEDIIQLKDQYYVLATSSLADQRTRVLKQGETFAVFDVYGNIQPVGHGTQGFYFGATRFLSFLELRIGGKRPLLLSSTVKRDNTLLTVDLMNRDSYGDEGRGLPGTLHVFRSKFLWEAKVYERLKVSNFSAHPVAVELSIAFRSDYADIFEIRGTEREKRGTYLPSVLNGDSVRLGYQGLDHKNRFTELHFSASPQRFTDKEAVFLFELPPSERENLFFTIEAREENSEPAKRISYSRALGESDRAIHESKAKDCEIVTSNPQFNDWIHRSQSDLHMMITQTSHGPYPYAGIPLFNTVFGRDGLITALQTLFVNSEIAQGVLSYLAATQATESNPEQDAEPGKILHEVRSGEMVALGEVPFRRYYGSADATPLFLLLAAEYYEVTGDLPFLRQLWPHVRLALEWVDRYGDHDGDGFVEYSRKSAKGLVNQGWKDSNDSIFHADGKLAEGSIALCEVQAYVFAAKRKLSLVARDLGEFDLSERLMAQALTLQKLFESSFWSEELSFYSLALDGKKRPCQVRTSNAGHALFGGMASRERALRLGEQLFLNRMFSGWGIRTVSCDEARYNPMSYHNGSIWPHDNSLIAEGLAEYGMKDCVLRLLTGLFEAARFAEENRLPELFCGFEKRLGGGPTSYPVACAPQAWASSSVFLLLKAAFGLWISGRDRKVVFRNPTLPSFLDFVVIKKLKCGKAILDIRIERSQHDVGINILRRDGPVEIVVLK